MSTTALDVSATSTSTNTPPQSSGSGSDDISPAAVTAIAVPIVLVVGAIIVSLAFFFRRYTVSRRPKKRHREAEQRIEGPDVDKWRLDSCAELTGDDGAAEANGEDQPHEADNGDARWELEGDGPSPPVELPSRRQTPAIPSRSGTMRSNAGTMRSHAGTTRTGRIRAGRSWLSLDLPRL